MYLQDATKTPPASCTVAQSIINCKRCEFTPFKRYQFIESSADIIDSNFLYNTVCANKHNIEDACLDTTVGKLLELNVFQTQV